MGAVPSRATRGSLVALLAVSLATLGAALGAPPSAQAQGSGGQGSGDARLVRRVVEPGQLLVNPSPPEPGSSGCSLSRGDAVRILSRVSGTNREPAEPYARVQVLSGRCMGAVGWLTAVRLSEPT